MTDLRTAHEEWLRYFEDSSLSLALRKMQERLDQALHDTDLHAAWTAIRSIRELSERLLDQRQLAETLLVTGRAAFELGDYAQAAELLHESSVQYDGDQHAHAVAKWMQGYVLWHIADRHGDAVAAWQTSLTDFTRLMHQPYHSDVDWYPQRIEEMQQALDESIELDGLPPRLYPPAGAGGRPAAAAPQPGDQPAAPSPGAAPLEAEPEPIAQGPAQEAQAPAAAPAAPKPEIPPAPERPERPPNRARSGYLGGFPVIEAVALNPAFQPVGADPHVDEQMTIEQVTIQEQAYGVYNPYGAGMALRLGNPELALVRVYGDSMDRAGMEEGDYALVHRQDNARNGDIVVAEIDGDDSKATIKRFKRVSKDLVQLISESSVEYPVREFKPGDPGFSIRGKVLAVFKKQSP